MVVERRNDDSNKGASKRKGLLELSIFCAAIAAGTACSISSKVLYELKGVGSDGTLQTFDKPLAQTLGMFVAMVFGLPIHWMIVAFRIPFPGYEQFQSKKENDNTTTDDDDELERLVAEATSSHDSPTTNNGSPTRVPLQTYFLLAIPAIFDLVTTALCMIGLVYLDVSIYQLLRGSGIIFTALIRTWALQQPLFKFQWVGVGFNVASIVLVGMVALLQTKSSPKEESFQQVVFAMFLMLLGTLVQSMQFVFEEKVMVKDETNVPPLLLFAMEGVWGTILCLTVLYPVGCVIPGNDNGMFEDPWNAWILLKNTRSIQLMMAIYLMAIFMYNLFAVLVTFLLSSVWHSILDNFRPMMVWMTDLCIYYIVTDRNFGEPWNKFSWIQLVGMVVLIIGTMIYNAPDSGSLLLKGQWYCCGIDFGDEYTRIQADRFGGLLGLYPSMKKFTLSTRSLHHVRKTSVRQIVHSPKGNGLVSRIDYGSRGIYHQQQSI
jgi:hypothetical protein